ncbi:MAG: hypothetical protein KIS79_14320 [Burkholderiales bacterium]|nr:hypothetical protein [Burkholderiales bacterium]
MTDLDFLNALHKRGVGVYERAIGLLWWVGRDNPTIGLTAREICSVLEATGLPTQNASRLNARLTEDRRTSKAGNNGGWRLHPKARGEFDLEYEGLTGSKPPRNSGSVIPAAIVSARGYLEKVVLQLNASYDAQLFDCCAVMCRRALETLLIEVYEHAGRAAEIKGADGHFLTLNGLASYFEQDGRFSPSRNALQGLRDFKKLGDLSAHNRRFNARREDIDRVRDGLRVAVEELAHLAGFRP